MGSRVLRPERNGSEIGTPRAIRRELDGSALSTSEIMLFEAWTTVVSDWLIKPVKCAAKGPRDVSVRALFFGLSDVSSLSDRFLDFPLFCVAFLPCVRYAFAVAASRLVFAVSAAFHARSACRTACFSAFSRATSSRAAWRANLRAFFFSSASRAFSSLMIAACSFLSL